VKEEESKRNYDDGDMIKSSVRINGDGNDDTATTAAVDADLFK
jgi:hypothetical protein